LPEPGPSAPEPVVGAPAPSAQPAPVPGPTDRAAAGEQRASESLADARTPAAEESRPAHERAPALEPEPTQSGDGESEPAVAAVLVDELAGNDHLETSGGSRVAPDEQPDIEIRDERVPAMREQEAFVEQGQAPPGYDEPLEGAQVGRPADRPVEQGQGERGYDEPPEPAPMGRPADGPVEQEHAQHRSAEPAPAEPELAPWTASIERRLERYQQDGHAFALLLLELADVERLRHAELPGEVARLTALVETALSAHLRPADSLMRETPGRYWLLAPQTDGSAALAVARQMTAAVGRAASHRGAPLRLAVGIAVCPRDALDAVELVDRAEVALYEALASGLALSRDADPSRLDDDLG
jgi:GGDEF domain-containing protein